jgi:uncharacterized protein (DUF2132 family)
MGTAKTTWLGYNLAAPLASVPCWPVASCYNFPMAEQPKNPLHGITLATIVDDLVAEYGWPKLGERIAIRCFTHDPSVKSTLTFLRRTPWARTQVEALYLEMLQRRPR